FLEGVFAFLHERYAERFLLGVYLSGLRGELEDAAELARLKGLEWRLEVVDGSSAYERSRIEDYFASWDWPLALLEERLSDAVLAERFKPF
ncbi:MAG: hypothetical protein P4L81_08135, partial [Candidatus Pacebacteria bacterium]|nr:hypothetical protein [Candidatus Paceibacterota bacterium]